MVAERPQGKKPEQDKMCLRGGTLGSWLKPGHKCSPCPIAGQVRVLEGVYQVVPDTQPIKQNAYFMPELKQLTTCSFFSKLGGTTIGLKL